MKFFSNFLFILIFTVFSTLSSRLNPRSSLTSKYLGGSVQTLNGIGEKGKQSQNYLKYFQRNFSTQSNEPGPDYHLDYDDISEARFTERRIGAQVRIIPEMSLENGKTTFINVIFKDYWSYSETLVLAIPRVNLGNLSFVHYASINYDSDFKNRVLRTIIEKKLPPELLKKYDGVMTNHLIWDGIDHGRFLFHGNSKPINWDLIVQLLQRTKIGKEYYWDSPEL